MHIWTNTIWSWTLTLRPLWEGCDMISWDYFLSSMTVLLLKHVVLFYTGIAGSLGLSSSILIISTWQYLRSVVHYNQAVRIYDLLEIGFAWYRWYPWFGDPDCDLWIRLAPKNLNSNITMKTNCPVACKETINKLFAITCIQHEKCCIKGPWKHGLSPRESMLNPLWSLQTMVWSPKPRVPNVWTQYRGIQLKFGSSSKLDL